MAPRDTTLQARFWAASLRVPVVGLLAVGEVRFDVEFEAAVTPPSMVKQVVNKRKCIYGEGREG